MADASYYWASKGEPIKVKTGLPGRFEKFIKGVLGQLSDGWGENNKRWDPYWNNMRSVVESDEVVIEVYIKCPLYTLSDRTILEFFAKNLKKTAKMALEYDNLGQWKRDNENTDYGYFSGNNWSVKEAYYAYDVLKGRDVNKFKEDYFNEDGELSF